MAIPAALMAAAPIAGMLGKLLSGGASASAQGRRTDNTQRLYQQQSQDRGLMDRAQLRESGTMNRAQLRESGLMDRARLEMQRAGFKQQEPGAQARQALAGSLLQRLQPLQSGGRGSGMSSIIDAISPEARQAGGLLQQRGLSGLQNPTQFRDVPEMQVPGVQVPGGMQQQALKQSGLLEKILGAGGLIGSVVGSLGDVNGLYQQTQGDYGRIDRTPPTFGGR